MILFHLQLQLLLLVNLSLDLTFIEWTHGRSAPQSWSNLHGVNTCYVTSSVLDQPSWSAHMLGKLLGKMRWHLAKIGEIWKLAKIGEIWRKLVRLGEIWKLAENWKYVKIGKIWRILVRFGWTFEIVFTPWSLKVDWWADLTCVLLLLLKLLLLLLMFRNIFME